MAQATRIAQDASTQAQLGEALQSVPSPRYREILEAAARLFAERGYAATSVREIGERVGLLGGSLYHHIKSKEALFAKIHELALQAAAERIRQAMAGQADPWRRLEAACLAMVEVQLDPDSLTMPLMSDLNALPPDLRLQVIAKRDEFEAMFTSLIADLPLPATIDRKIYRLALLTLLNNISTWFRPGLLTPAEIGRQIAEIFRRPLA